MSKIDDVLNGIYDNPPPETLYHYTGMGSLQKIVETKPLSLWASSAFHLNDGSEIKNAVDLLKEEIEKYLKNNPKDKNEENFNNFIGLLDGLAKNKIDFHEVLPAFVFSLSSKRDLLSQWRGYTPHGKGVSIGFDTKNLITIIENHPKIASEFDHGLKFAKCIYGGREIISDLLEGLIEEFNANPSILNYSTKEKANTLSELIIKLLQIFVFIKHEAFSEEEEWRIACIFADVEKIEFREGDSMLIPFIKIGIDNSGNPDPIFNDICIGPTQNEDLSFLSLQTFLSSNKQGQVLIKKLENITFSNIPYRKV